MANDEEFRLRLIESRESHPPEARDGVVRGDLSVSPELILDSMKATAGAEELIAELPELGKIEAWSEVAYFSVCEKRGYARYLDIWDADHFDGFTDMHRCITDCRAWFSADGYAGWGSAETKTGRVNCYFYAPTAGNYICTASLQSYPSTQQSMVECLIDNSSFGPLPFTGTIHQPHPCLLTQGGHHFRIRQLRGSFFFLALTVHRV